MFRNFKNCLFNNETVYRSQEKFKSYNHDVYTEEVNKIALSSNDDKRLQTFDGITTYPYETNDFKVCESEMRMVKDLHPYETNDFKVCESEMRMVKDLPFENYNEIVLKQ